MTHNRPFSGALAGHESGRSFTAFGDADQVGPLPAATLVC
jgi:hypothetical protein